MILLIWEYRVKTDRLHEFLEAYRPDGAWARLFQRGDGYLGTELHEDSENPLRFVTIDRWESTERWEAFRSECESEYRDLDRRCEELTEAERKVGQFRPSARAR